MFERHGLPLSLYTDRGAHYFHTMEAGEKAGRAGLTQVGRALEHLGVHHIAAYSPQARGRSERAFQTLQDRLTKELTLAGIATIEAANVFIRDIYIPSHNARFVVPAEQEGSAFVAIPGVELAEILCIQEERQVGNDNCVRFKNAQAANSRKPAARPFRQGHRQGPPVPGRPARHFLRQEMPGPIRSRKGFRKRRKSPPDSSETEAAPDLGRRSSSMAGPL